jgi:4-amino-4-deoxy-L-arabinose transferase-like glycosyltransferase
MNPADKSPVMWRRPLLLPLILIVAINATALVVFARVGSSVGADFGTDGYKEIAENVVKGNGFVYSPGTPSTMMYGWMKREPLYPLWLSGILAITGSLSPVVLCLFQTPLSMLACSLLYRLGSRMFDARIGTLASYIYALHPISFWYTTRFASEIVAIPISLLCLLAIDTFFTQFTPRSALLAGWSIGIAALTKSAFVVLVPLVLLFTIIRRCQKSLLAMCAAALICSFLSIHSLWLLRNYRISGEIVPFTTMNGVIFFVGNRIVEQFDPGKLTAGNDPEHWAEALYGSVQADISAKQPDIALPRLEAETDRHLSAMARELVIARPWFVARKVFSGMFFIWFLSDSTAKSVGWAVFQFPLVALAIVGVYARRSWTTSEQLSLTFTIVFLLAYIFVSPYARYALAISPILMLFASEGLTTLMQLSLRLGSRPLELQA